MRSPRPIHDPKKYAFVPDPHGHGRLSAEPAQNGSEKHESPAAWDATGREIGEPAAEMPADSDDENEPEDDFDPEAVLSDPWDDLDEEPEQAEPARSDYWDDSLDSQWD